METPNPFDALHNLSLDGPDSPRAGPAASDAATATTSDNGAEAAAAAATVAPPPPSRRRAKLWHPIVWIDLEMTGLDPEKDTIIEIACLVTDGQLHTVVEGPDLAIHHSEEVLAGMNEWCQHHHTASGLVERVRASTVSLREAEEAVLAFVQANAEYQAASLAGNSVHIDRAFLARHMPRLLSHLHYRIVDVSTVAELARMWAPKAYKTAPPKRGAHTAMSDIRESLRELQHYRKALFVKK